LSLIAIATLITPTERFSKIGAFIAYVVIAVLGVALSVLFVQLREDRESGPGKQ
jgi:hypothetical protein